MLDYYGGFLTVLKLRSWGNEMNFQKTLEILTFYCFYIHSQVLEELHRTQCQKASLILEHDQTSTNVELGGCLQQVNSKVISNELE